LDLDLSPIYHYRLQTVRIIVSDKIFISVQSYLKVTASDAVLINVHKTPKKRKSLTALESLL